VIGRVIAALRGSVGVSRMHRSRGRAVHPLVYDRSPAP
jgi:hypothetical protein